MKPLKVAIAGLGTIGRTVARSLNRGMQGLELAAAAVGDREKARAWLEKEGISTPLVGLEELPERADIIIEAAPASVFERVIRPALDAGKTAVVLSSGALLRKPELVELANAKGARLVVPSGGLLGLDAVLAAAEGTIHSVRMTTRKPPGGLVGAPHLEKNGISLEGLKEPLRVFSGTAREAVAGFPANVNVVATVSLAGIGPERTTIEIWADPTVTRNCHKIEVESDSARFTVETEVLPSENPKTGRIVALSVVAALRKLTSTLRIGT
ncbi:MAG TPA: aspartate dehydrogenase [Burkholderiales bacterium]|nr:aspartate dehydrogenase [Burkholderiales bacterium]